jgi:hypothetical protein
MMRVQDSVYPDADPLSSARKAILWLIVALMLAATVITYRYYLHLPPVCDSRNYYGMLGDAFLSGQTSLKKLPPPQLLALKDPYDPAASRPDILWDASFYKGRYYLYFGPVPAVLWAAVKYATGIGLSDPELVFGFASCATACLTLLLVLIALHERMAIRAGLACAMLSLALGIWIPFMLRRPSFYEAAISGAYCFSALGLLMLWQGLGSPRRISFCWLALASLSFGLAAGCRLSHIFNIIPLAAAWLFILRKSSGPDAFAAFLCLLIPWACCLAGIMAYNYARFGSPFESGLHYQLTFYNPHSPEFRLLGVDHFIPNAYFYLFRPLALKTPLTFPFLHIAGSGKIALPFNIVAQTSEPVYGLFTNSPFALWILAAPWCRIKCPKLTQETRVITSSVALYGTALLGFLLFFFYIAARYSIDFAPWLMFIAGTQYLRVLSMAKTRQGYSLLLTLGIMTALYGAFIGALSGDEPQK